MHEVPVTFVASHSGLGGSESYLERVITALGKGWVESVVALGPGPFVDRMRSAHWPVHVIATGGAPTDLLRAAVALRRWSRRRTVRLVHANGVKAATVAAAAMTGTRIPVIWVKHDFSWDGRLTRVVAPRCAEVIGVSAAVLGAVPKSVPTSVVAPGVDVDGVADRPAARALARRLAGAPGPVVSLVGRLDPAKGHLDALSVLSELRPTHPGLRALFIGGDDPAHPHHRQRLQSAMDAMGVAGQVRLLGHRPDAREIIAGSDLVVLPSRAADRRGMGNEGFGLVAAEAMALGTPLVAYAAGALPEVVGDCGVLVPPGDVAALRRAVATVLDDEALRERLSRCGAGRAAMFSLELTVDRLADRYRALARP